jgi:hypothetical protein
MGIIFLLKVWLGLVLSTLCLAARGQEREEDATRVNPPECGKLYEDAARTGGKRFLSSTRAIQRDFGWQVSVSEEDVTHTFGGSLINSQWVLTHAHGIEYYIEFLWLSKFLPRFYHLF